MVAALLGADDDYLYAVHALDGDMFALRISAYNLLTREWREMHVQGAHELFECPTSNSDTHAEQTRNYSNACFVARDAHGDGPFFLLCKTFVDRREHSYQDFTQFVALQVDGIAGKCRPLNVIDMDGTLREHTYLMPDTRIFCANSRLFYIVFAGAELALPDGMHMLDSQGHPNSTCGVYNVFKLAHSGRTADGEEDCWLWECISRDTNLTIVRDRAQQRESTSLLAELDRIARAQNLRHTFLAPPHLVILSSNNADSLWLDKALLFNLISRRYSLMPIHAERTEDGIPLANITSRLDIAHNGMLFYPGEKFWDIYFDDAVVRAESASFFWALNLTDGDNDSFRWKRLSFRAPLRIPVYGYLSKVGNDGRTLYVVGGINMCNDGEETTAAATDRVQSIQLQPKLLSHIAMQTLWDVFIRGLVPHAEIPFDPKLSSKIEMIAALRSII